jgi:hypothetical protein
VVAELTMFATMLKLPFRLLNKTGKGVNISTRGGLTSARLAVRLGEGATRAMTPAG